MKMLTWFKSWFSTSGTLGFVGYAKHIAVAFVLFLGISFLGLGLFSLASGVWFAFHAPAWAGGLLVFLVWGPFALLAMCTWGGILIGSTIRFGRHLMAACASRDDNRDQL
jgi:hypothetical protein